MFWHHSCLLGLLSQYLLCFWIGTKLSVAVMMSIYLRRFWWHGNDNMECKLCFGLSRLVASNTAKSAIVIHWSSAQEELTFPFPSSAAHTVDIVVLPHIDIIDQSGAIVNLSLLVHPPNIGLRNGLQQIRCQAAAAFTPIAFTLVLCIVSEWPNTYSSLSHKPKNCIWDRCNGTTCTQNKCIAL